MKRRLWARSVAAWLLLLLVALAAGGCHIVAGYDDIVFSDIPITDKVDVLLVIDNSRGAALANKDELFETGISPLLHALTTEVDDIHVGVISTSLGSVGGTDIQNNPICDTEQANDKGHLLSRDGDGGLVTTYQDNGFLVWDPKGLRSPAGHSDLDDFKSKLRKLVVGVGEDGCGFEATMESWYRFLIDTNPHAEVTIDDDGIAVPEGTDATVLMQRAAFLRPDSLVLVVVISDEDDCSIRAGGQGYLATSIGKPMWKGRGACENFPNDRCCTSCGAPPVPGCNHEDEECLALTEEEDHPNLRCFNQKQRFGIDFKYPVERYIEGLSLRTLGDAEGSVVSNPLFAFGRDPKLVVYTGIVGVPWQDIARRTASGEPDLSTGLNARNEKVGGVQTAAEMRANTTWDLILGDPLRHVGKDPKPPLDPFMHQSEEPRTGNHPLTGDPLSPIDGSSVNAINGHEYDTGRADLQYACTFKLKTPKECDPAAASCFCEEQLNDQLKNPLCRVPEDGGADAGSYGTKQYYAQAYPAVRHLQMMKVIGDKAILGSLCTAEGQVASDLQAYQAAANSVMEVVRPMLVRELP